MAEQEAAANAVFAEAGPAGIAADGAAIADQQAQLDAEEEDGYNYDEAYMETAEVRGASLPWRNTWLVATLRSCGVWTARSRSRLTNAVHCLAPYSPQQECI